MLGFAQGHGFAEIGAGLIAQIPAEGIGVVVNSIWRSRKPRDSLHEFSLAQLIIFRVRVGAECGYKRLTVKGGKSL